MTSIDLPTGDGGWSRLTFAEPTTWVATGAPAADVSPAPTSRVAFGAAHVVADPFGDNVPGGQVQVDWEATLGFRRHLFEHGLGVAEAMDTAQRNMGLDWPTAAELIRRSAAQARDYGARIASGVGTDLLPAQPASLREVTDAYLTQLEVVEDAGSQAIIMASRHLAAAATSPDDYLSVYDEVVRQASDPVILHWLGPAFDPALSGYWGADQVEAATDHFVDLVSSHSQRIDGVKVSLLDADHEKGLRRRLPAKVRLYTGDDFNYPELIAGDGEHHSDALLGIFAAIAPAAGAALRALDRGDRAAYDAAFEPTLPLARHIFTAPTFYYKTGIAFMAWINGHQPGFTMLGGLQSARSVVHLAEIVRLADAAGLITDPDLAAGRMTTLLNLSGMSRG